MTAAGLDLIPDRGTEIYTPYSMAKRKKEVKECLQTRQEILLEVMKFPEIALKPEVEEIE